MASKQDDNSRGSAHLPPVIFEADKKQNFGISNSGDFIDNIYRELDSSKLYGKIIGRNYVTPHAKKTFTSADIVCEGYLHKKGSWRANWKKRYFILRKDIRAICYYASRDDLTLLGSIPLDIESEVCNVQPEQADGYSHVVSVETEGENGQPPALTFIRFESFEQMKAWMIDIKNEAHNMLLPDSALNNWWQTLFGGLTAMEPKSLARRDGLTVSNKDRGGSGGGGNREGVSSRKGDLHPGAGKQSPKASKICSEKPHTNGSERVFCSVTGEEIIVDTKASRQADLSEDELSDTEEGADASRPRMSPPTTPALKRNESGGSTGATSTADGSSSREISVDTGTSQVVGAVPSARKARLSSRKAISGKKKKPIKTDKKPGVRPFENPTADRFEVVNAEEGHTLSGLQLSLRMCNVCGYQDRIFVVIFGSGPSTEFQQPELAGKRVSGGNISSSGASSTAAVTAPGSAEAAAAANTPSGHTSKWTQLSRTEVRAVVDKPDYGENYVGEVKIHFQLVQELIPDYCKEIKVVVYRLENEMNPQEPGKATNLSMQLEIARAVFAKKQLEKEFKTVKKINMSVKIEMPMDIAIPLFKDSDVQLGIVKLSSPALQEHRRQITQSLGINPYAEMMYSFCTHAGQTLSLEHLYASKYAVATAAGLLGLWRAERRDYMNEVLDTMEAEYHMVITEHEDMIRPHLLPGENAEEKTKQTFAAFRQAIDEIEDIAADQEEAAYEVLSSCADSMAGKAAVNAAIDENRGGALLRRSTWKKVPAWQYMTTNLNVHMMTSKHFTFSELAAANSSDAKDHALYKSNSRSFHSNMHFSPTMTLGVPAAHELKFHDGGLRRIFAEITDTGQKLRWMHALQLPTMEYLQTLLRNHPKEATALFGSRSNFVSKEDMAHVLKKKSELGRRIDICGSQALGLAVATIRTLCVLAGQVGGQYIDILARSLKIGFLVMFESMLSTQGDELGMIEDMDLAVLWLSLVTVRLVLPKEQPQSKHKRSANTSANTSAQDANSLSNAADQLSPPPPPPPSSVGNSPAVTSTATSVDGSLSAGVANLSLNAGEHGTGTGVGIAESAAARKAAAVSNSNHGLLLVGSGDGITCFRDGTGRLTVDIEISPKEAAAVLQARDYMADFDRVCVTQALPPDCSFAFKPASNFSLETKVEATSGGQSRAGEEQETAGRSDGDRLTLSGENELEKDIRAALMHQERKAGSMTQQLLSNAVKRVHEFSSYVIEERYRPRVFAVAEIFGIVFSQGVNEMQTLANMSSSRDVQRQAEVNVSSMVRLESFYASYQSALQYQLVRKTPELLDALVEHSAAAAASSVSSSVGEIKRGVGMRKQSLRSGSFLAAAMATSSMTSAPNATVTAGLGITVESLKTKVINANDRLMGQAREAVKNNLANPYEKHIDVLLKTSALCRLMGGIVGILCKSGKDRTSMGVTLENTRALVEDLGALGGQEVCQTMRLHGVRRMNVYANTGQSMFAFNQIQRIALPNCYRAPPGSHAGNIVS